MAVCYSGRRVRHLWDDALSRMDGLEFERLMARHYEAQGYRVEHAGTAGTKRRYDGGIDLKLHRDGRMIVVQCKRHTPWQTTHNPVHELVGVMHTQRADGAVFITTGEFTEAALSSVRDFPNFELIDGHAVRRMLGPMLATLKDPTDRESARTGAGTWEAVGSPSVRWPAGSDIAAPSNRRSESSPGYVSWGVIALAIVVLGLTWYAQQGRDDLGPSQARIAQPAPAAGAPPVRVPQPVMQPMRRPDRLDANASGQTWKRPTQAEIRESRRRADEAVQILGDRAPEM